MIHDKNYNYHYSSTSIAARLPCCMKWMFYDLAMKAMIHILQTYDFKMHPRFVETKAKS